MNEKIVVLPEQLHSRTPGGIGVFTTEALAHMATQASQLGVRLSIYGSKFDRDTDPFAAFGLPVSYSRLHHRMLMMAWDRGLASENGTFDASVSFSMAAPLTRAMPRRLVTVYDLAFRTVPAAFTRHGVRWHEARLNAIRRSSASVLTISEQSRGQLLEADFSADRIFLATPGSDHLAPADLERTGELLERLGVRTPFLLTVGTLEPRKNLARVMESVQICRGELRDEYPLLVVGARGWGPHAKSVRGVHFLGHIDGSLLAGLYARAAALVYAPLFEGFGLPPIEAMASCTAVVSSLLPSTDPAFCEIVDPRSAEDIARGICDVLSNDRRKSRLVREALLHVSGMRWEDTARDILNAATAGT